MKPFYVSALLFLFSQSVFAGKSQNRIINTFEEFSLGKMENVLLSIGGSISVSNEIEKAFQLDVLYGWRIVQCRNRYYISSASPACVFSYPAEGGKIDTLIRYDGGGIFGLCSDGENVFAAVSPAGEVLRIRGSSVEKIFERESLSVWDMACLPGRKLALATSNRGRVYLISYAGELLDSIETGDRSAVSLAVRRDTLYIGTSGRGFLLSYSLTTGSAYVEADPNGNEINSICATDDCLLFSTVSGNIDISGLSSLRLTVDPYFYIPPSSSEITSNVYRFQSGRYELLFSSPSPPVTAVFPIQKNIYCAVGAPDGSVFLYDANKREISMFRAPEERILTSWAKDNSGKFALLGTNPLTIYIMTGKSSNQGIYTTGVIDGGERPVWGNFFWTGDGSVRIQARTGNTSSPDEFWSDWTRETADFDIFKNELPQGNKIQFRLAFTGRIDKLEFLFSAQNRKPVVQVPVVYAPGSASYGISQTVPDIKPLSAGDPEKRLLSLGGWQIPQNAVSFQTSYQGLSFEANDPDGDSMTYDIYIRPSNKSEWLKIGWLLRERHFAFNRQFFRDGEYFLKIIASDSISNPANSFLTDSAFSEVFVIDNTPPEVYDFSFSGSSAVFAVRDSKSRIISVSFSFDGINWQDASPKDGVFDSKSEHFQIEIAGMRSEVMMIKAKDAHFNTAMSYFGL
ncbi:hypothetical protein JW890_01750 [candidate division WOR-3 bacterium]|nr:hypothetical protein [candidate division WOR-3 bacterium]